MPLGDVAKDLIAGTLGGAGGIVVGHPIDTVKVRLQVDRSYGGVVDCVMKTWKLEGPSAYYKGVVAPVLGAAPINAVVFMTYGGVIRWASEYHFGQSAASFLEEDIEEPDLPIYYHTMAGFSAGAAQNVFGTPNELVKIKCQMNRKENVRSIPMAMRLLRNHGLSKGLYQGWWLTFWRDTPAFGIYFTTYECSRGFLQRTSGLSDMWTVFFAGGIAGSSSFFFTHPVDVVKSLRQEQPSNAPRNQTGIIYHVRAAINESGYRFFLRGLGPSVFRAYPVSAVTFLIYDSLLSALST